QGPRAEREGTYRQAEGLTHSTAKHLAPELGQRAGGQRLTDPEQQPRHEPQVVDRRELLTQLLVRFEQVPQVRPRVARTGVTVATDLDRPRVPGEADVLDVQPVPGVHARLRR